MFEVFNSTGTNIHYHAQGIPLMDSFSYFVYPCFMALLFVVAGISARYSLKKRTTKEFANERIQKLFIPFVLYMLIFAPVTAGICFLYMGGWSDFTAYVYSFGRGNANTEFFRGFQKFFSSACFF